MLNLENKVVTIIGAKRSGMAAAKLVLHHKGKPRLTDQCPPEQIPESSMTWIKANNIPLELNAHTEDFMRHSDIMVLSPGVRRYSQITEWAHEKGIPVLGEIEFAAQFCTWPIIAITGSNGKTTVSTLTYLVLNHGGIKASLCGNVGYPFSECLLDNKPKDYIVLEISSFQLESLLSRDSIFRNGHNKNKFKFIGFKPHIAVFLNFSQNHLDRHKDLEEYLEAKSRIFYNQEKDDFAVLNAKDAYVRSVADTIFSKPVYFLDEEQSKLPITNPNFLAVLRVAEILKIPQKKATEVFDNFKGVEHRMELVRNINGIDFVNDSKSTTAEATRWILERSSKPILMICGGRDKNIDFSVLRELVQKKVKKMFVIGEAKDKISKAFGGTTRIELCDNLEKAVLKAKEEAKSGDSVILSPMCTSFDMFLNFEDRGKKFKEIVNRIN